MLVLRNAALAAIPALCLFAGLMATTPTQSMEVALRSELGPKPAVERYVERNRLDVVRPSEFSNEILSGSLTRVESRRFTRPSDLLRAHAAGKIPVTPKSGVRRSGIRLTQAKGLPLARRWAGASEALQSAREMLAACEAGDCASPALQRVATQISTLRNKPRGQRIASVKRYMTRHIRYVADRIGHDVWASPQETILARAGDCEDHAILAWALLAHAGIDTDDMALLVLRNRQNGIGHAVIAVRTGDGTKLVLDNNLKRPVEQTPKKYSLLAVADAGGFFVPVAPSQPKPSPALAKLALR
ncbi:MAG: transglutaminase-like cysteine peptidase [Pseudomonadota bacterium]